MNEPQLSSWEKQERKQPLSKAVTARFMECLRSHGPKWGTPAMEAVVDSAVFDQPRPIRIRIFDMNGDGEVPDPSPALREAIREYHAVCASLGEDWGRALLTLILSPDRKTGQFVWDFTYPH